MREIASTAKLTLRRADPAALREFCPRGVILSGSPESTTVADGSRIPQAVLELDTPPLGICYGMQAMAVQLGGRVESADHQEFGYAQVRAHAHSTLLRDIEDHASPEGYGLLDVDESRRSGGRFAARFHPHRQHRNLARSPAWPTRIDAGTGCSFIPSDAHPPGRAHSAAFRVGYLRLRAVVDHRQHHRQHRRHPCAGGWRRGTAGAVRRVDSSVVAALLCIGPSAAS